MTAPSLLATLSPEKLARIPRRKNQPEFEHQCNLFTWARNPAIVRALPGIELLEGSLNGVKLTKAQAGKAKAAGMLKGSHDVRLPVARGRWIGLSIELKHGDNRPTKEQRDIGALLEAEGWQVHFIWDWDDAKAVIEQYLSLQRPNVIACA